MNHHVEEISSSYILLPFESQASDLPLYNFSLKHKKEIFQWSKEALMAKSICSLQIKDWSIQISYNLKK